MAESTGHLAGGGVAADHYVGVAALLEVRIEDRFAGRAPARLPLQQVDAMEVTGFAHQPPCAAILPVVAQARSNGLALPLTFTKRDTPVSLWRGTRLRPSHRFRPRP